MSASEIIHGLLNALAGGLCIIGIFAVIFIFVILMDDGNDGGNDGWGGEGLGG